MLLQNEGISNDIRKAFVIYLAGHNRPIHELLNPNLRSIEDIGVEYESDFRGMTEKEVPLEKLISCQHDLPQLVKSGLLDKEKHFLISLKEGNPKWSLLDAPGVEKLPALLWKLQNIQDLKKKNKKKWNRQLQKLKSLFGY